MKKEYLGILDWGIGGFGFYRLIKKYYPNLCVMYFSDSGSIPYGKLNAKELRLRIDTVFNVMKKHGTRSIVVACHSASTVAKDILIDDVDVHTIFQPTASYLEALHRRLPLDKTIALIGGQATIKSQIYNHQYLPLKQMSAQTLSAFVERGELSSTNVYEEVESLVNSLTQNRNLSQLILACTHYPALLPAFKKYLPNTKIIDPVDFLLEDMKIPLEKLIQIQSLCYKNSIPCEDIFITTGHPSDLRKNSSRAFGVAIRNERISRISI